MDDDPSKGSSMIGAIYSVVGVSGMISTYANDSGVLVGIPVGIEVGGGIRVGEAVYVGLGSTAYAWTCDLVDVDAVSTFIMGDNAMDGLKDHIVIAATAQAGMVSNR